MYSVNLSYTQLMTKLVSLVKVLILLVIYHMAVFIRISDKIILKAGSELDDVSAYSELVERNNHFTEMMTRPIE